MRLQKSARGRDSVTGREENLVGKANKSETHIINLQKKPEAVLHVICKEKIEDSPDDN